MNVEVILNERLRVRKMDLPPGHEAQIKQRLTVVNGEKAAALKRRQWGAQDLPDDFALYEDDGPWLVAPRGYAAELRAGLERSGHSVRWEDKTSATSLPLRELVHDGPALREDQEQACMALLRARQGVLQAPTAAGKTVLVLEAWRRVGVRGLILVEKAGLAKQWIDRAREHLGVEAGMIGEGEWDERPLTVAMLQTLRRRDLSPFWWRRWGFTCADECFPAGTMVDGTPIEEIDVGDSVLSFDESSSRLVSRRVTHVFRKSPSALVRVWIGGREPIVCTPEHPFLTERGWMAARDLSGQVVLSSKDERNHLYVVRQAGGRDDEGAARRTQEDRSHLLLEDVRLGDSPEGFVGDDVSHEPALRVGENEGTQSNETPGGAQTSVGSAQGDRAQAADTGWQWPRPYGVREVARRFLEGGKHFHVGVASRRDDGQGQPEPGPAVALQARRRIAGEDDRNRGGRVVTLGVGSSRARQTQGGVLTWARVDRVEVLQPGSDGRYGGLCPDGLVYNLEVEGTSTYLADGVVVHNCHHLAAETYQAVVRQACSRYLVGVTATPLEGDWRQPYMTHVIGPVFHITTPETLRRVGVRVTPTVRRVRTGWRWQPSAQEAKLVDTKAIYRHVLEQFQGRDLHSDHRIQLIAATIVKQPQSCAQLVVSKRLGILERIRDMLEFFGYQGAVHDYRGSVSGDERAEVARLADGGACVILATVADEGVDIPRLDRLHLVWPARKELTLTQQIGRVLRTHPDKREVVIYDYVDEEGMLQSQAQARLRVYRRAGYPIEEERAVQGSLT